MCTFKNHILFTFCFFTVGSYFPLPTDVSAFRSSFFIGWREIHLSFHYSYMQVDKVLKDLWFQYVPKKMKEQEFWRRYFIAVKRIRQDVINSDSDNSVGRSWSNIERRLTFVGIGNEVCVVYLLDIIIPLP